MGKMTLSAMMTLNDIGKSYATYIMYNDKTAIVYIGYEPLTKLFTLSGARRQGLDLDVDHVIVVDKVLSSRVDAVNRHAYLCKTNGFRPKPKPRTFSVKCIETGEEFPTAMQCAAAHGLGQSALYNHLNNKPGFRSVKGKTYEKIVDNRLSR